MAEPAARHILPIPDRPAPKVTTFDAKDLATAFPTIEPLRPPAGSRGLLLIRRQ